MGRVRDRIRKGILEGMERESLFRSNPNETREVFPRASRGRSRNACSCFDARDIRRDRDTRDSMIDSVQREKDVDLEKENVCASIPKEFEVQAPKGSKRTSMHKSRRPETALSEHINEDSKAGVASNTAESSDSKISGTIEDLHGKLLSLPQQMAQLSAALRLSNDNLRSCHVSLSKAVSLDASRRMSTPKSVGRIQARTPVSPEGSSSPMNLTIALVGHEESTPSALESFKDDKTAEKKANDPAENSVHQLCIHCAELEDNLAKAQEKYDQMKKELDDKFHTMESESKARIQKLENDIAFMQERSNLSAADSDVKLSHAIAEHVALASRLELEKITMEQELSQIISNLTSKLEVSQSALSSLQMAKSAELAELSAKLESLKEDYESRLQVMDATSGERDSASKQVTVLQRRIEDMQLQNQESIRALEDELAEAKSTIANLESQLLREAKGQQTLQEELEETVVSLAKQQEELRILKEERTQLQEQLAQISQEKLSMEEELKCSQEMCTSLQDCVQEKLKDIECLHEEIEAEKSHNSKACDATKAMHMQQLEDMEQKYTQANQALETQMEIKLEEARKKANSEVLEMEQKFMMELQNKDNAFLLEKEALTKEYELKHSEFQCQLDNAHKAATELVAQHKLDMVQLRVELTDAFQEERKELIQAAEEAKADLSGQLRLVQQEAEDASTQHSAELQGMKARHGEELCKIKQEREEAVTKLGEAHANELLSLREKHSAEIVSLREEAKAAMKSQRLAEEAQTRAFHEKKAAEVEAARAQEAESLAKKEAEDAVNRYRKEFLERRKIFKQLQELKGNVRVMARVRPLLPRELEVGGKECASYPEVGCVEISQPAPRGAPPQQTAAGRKRRYEYDEVFLPSSSQEDIFEATEPLLISVLDGYNCSIFAYGQTGSGKTYTMEGENGNAGIAQRIVESLYDGANVRGKAGWEYTFTLSAIEIYNEQVHDLLQCRRPSKKSSWVGTGGEGKPLHQEKGVKLEVHETADGVSLPGLTKVASSSAEDALAIIQKVQMQRATEATKMNDTSSRSHSVIMIEVDAKDLSPEDVEGSAVVRSLSGRLALVDLAGSERLNRSDASGDRLKEAQHINKSLSALGDVIAALANKSKHVPYRNSTLTRVLRDGLQQGGKALLMACVSASDLDAGETCCTLGFAQRTRGVECGAAKRNAR